MFQKILIVAAAIVATYSLITFIRIRVLASRAGEYIATTQKFEQSGTSNKKVLILGDSIAYGTGTSAPENSLAGVIVKQNFPDAKVTNLSKNGLRTNELADQIRDIEGSYDFILIVIGGNDIMRPWISLDDTAENLEVIYAQASELSEKVVALSTGNFKYTNFFLPPLNYYFGGRSVAVRNAAQKAAEDTKVQYVDIISYNERSAFTADMEAEDRLHLSDKGVRYWYEEISRTTTLK